MSRVDMKTFDFAGIHHLGDEFRRHEIRHRIPFLFHSEGDKSQIGSTRQPALSQKA